MCKVGPERERESMCVSVREGECWNEKRFNQDRFLLALKGFLPIRGVARFS